MSNAVTGKSGKINLSDTDIAETRNWSIRRKYETVDTTSQDSGGHRERKFAVDDWGGEFETIAFRDLHGSQGVGSFMVNRTGASASEPVFHGTILITEAPAEVEYAGEVKYRHTFEGSGACTVAVS